MSCFTRTSCPSSKCNSVADDDFEGYNKLYCLYFVYMFVLLYVCGIFYVHFVFLNENDNK